MGRGGAFSAKGSVTPGMAGIRGGSERALADPARSAEKSAVESIVNKLKYYLADEGKAVELLRGFEQIVSWFIYRGSRSPSYTSMVSVMPSPAAHLLRATQP